MKLKTRACLPASLVCLILAMSAAIAAPDKATQAILTRLDQAAQRQRAGAAEMLPLEKDLLWLLNFEQDGVMLTGEGGVVPITQDARYFRPGKFGRGFLFEPTQQNFLPPQIADVEEDISGFTAVDGAKLESVPADTAFGKRALSVTMPAAGAGCATVPAKVNLPPRYANAPDAVLTASCFVKGPKDARVTLTAQLVPLEAPDPETKELGPDPTSNVVKPQSVALTGGWQRVACTVSTHSRVPARQATLTIAAAAGAPMTLLVDGLQFERSNYYPFYRNTPTTWTPGGQTRPWTVVSLTAPKLLRDFPTHEGAISLWTQTPHETNLDGAGSVSWFSFLRGWTDPDWTLDTYRINTGAMVDPGGKPIPVYSGSFLGPVIDGQWHHVAIVWDRAGGGLYRDGKRVLTFTRQDPDISKLVDSYALRIGGNREQAASSVVDELAVFKRALTAEEVEQLAAGAAPLRASASPFLASFGPRATYYRDEATAACQVKLWAPSVPDGSVTVCGAFDNLLAFEQSGKLMQHAGEVTLQFSPARLKCGDYHLRLAVTGADGKTTSYHEYPITVAPALRRDRYPISSWGTSLSADWFTFYHTVGLNCLDLDSSDPAVVDNLGKQGFLFNWHYNVDREGDYSPARRQVVKDDTARLAQRLAPFPNWWGALLNTETGPGYLPNDEQRKAWFDAWAEEQFGGKIPAAGWKFGSPHNPILCLFPEGQKPGADGVYTQVPDTFKFLDWWNNQGGVYWRINALAAKEVKTVRPDVCTWTDPAISAGEAADLDAIGTWSYQTNPATLLNELQGGYDLLRGSGKTYFATLGMNYVAGGLTVTEPDGVKKTLMPTPDDMIQQSWLAVAALPTDGLFYWDMDGWFLGQRGQNERYAPAGSDALLGAVLKNDLQPLGTMLQGVPNAQRPVALLLPESTGWFVAGEGGFSWGSYHYPNIWRRLLAESDISYDCLYDRQITPAALSKYKVVIFPMPIYVSSRVAEALTAAANAGTQIMVDGYCKQTYPNMTQLKMRYDVGAYFNSTPEKQEAYLKEGREALAALQKTLQPDLRAYAVGKEGWVFVNARESEGVTYVSVINNNRQDGPYTQWTKNANFRPYGKAQQATVYLKVPQGSAVYEFTTSKKLPATWQDGHLVVTVDLPPHAGRLLCVYPAELATLALKPAPAYQLGVPATFSVSLLDRAGKAPAGRQLVYVQITDPTGQAHDESGYYRMEHGQVVIPFRPALNDAAGTWQVMVTERSTGLTAKGKLTVK